MWLLRAIWVIVLAVVSLLFLALVAIAAVASWGAVIDVEQEAIAEEIRQRYPDLNVPIDSAETKRAWRLTEIAANFAVVMTAVGVWVTFLRRKWHDWYP